MIKCCKICNIEFETKNSKSVCSDACNKRLRVLNRVAFRSENITGIEGIDYLVCKWCGLKVGRIYGMHITKYHEKTLEEYTTEFPGAPIYTKKDITNVTKNGGLHMKEEKYRTMFSEMAKGDKNPNHKSKTTEEWRKSISPYSIEFYKRKYPELNTYEHEIKLKEFLKYQDDGKIRTNQIQYYLNKGFSQDESEKLLKERQTTFTLEKCITKYGKVLGPKKYLDRQERWIKNYKKSNFSKISQKLFWEIYNLLDDGIKENEIYFATINDGILDDSGKNNEFRLKLEEYNSMVMPDFFIKNFNLIIEFDGIYWHFKRNDIENKKRNEERNKKIIKSGYLLLNINESDYIKDPQLTVNKCLDFIKAQQK